MRVHVAFHPLVVTAEPQVCIVVDVIRASTTLVTMVERGAGRIYVAETVDAARRAAARMDGAILAGEENGLPPAGFHYGNSPVEVARAAFGAAPVIFVTTNGTAAIRRVAKAPVVLVGALRNARAAARQAAELARVRGLPVTVVCAGREGGFGLDDAYTAGALVDRLLEVERSAELTDGSAAALRLYRGERDALALFRESAAGRNVIRLGLEEDVVYCARADVSEVVPRLSREVHVLESVTSGHREDAGRGGGGQ
ncbi:MAG: 2-phosphosulfolactate phosphatase [Armatimonadota bacterium]|nr:2-phosphosulfolactate phosphatase [Armatimonadota bacterium]MDR7401803.1 2-phosphosulfolactate phosphatase [Armatimonadota bacterium]MDR7403105.1 2-phosphosulfolactate phosphatase [Armatimonadota bacterium]MDR7436192.1 2-phosphosulfolactate phosphatase [Armatimonadota bacterium]MDR7471427.1 2-phosphosulfolactate phosphatase [Armatimonadota bacterium]